MITTPTVLILGAGASMGFGYPSGSALKQNILSHYNQNFSIFKILGYTDENIKTFGDALQASGRTSVDAFLEHREDLVNIGKIAIALELISHESHASLFNSENNWYDYLNDHMNCVFNDFQLNKITFITFNYDRSLEYYLFNALSNSYGKNEKEVAVKLNQIPIIHVHGKLGNLPWQGANGRIYFDKILFKFNKKPELQEQILKDINIAAQGIQIISEISDVEKNFASVTTPLLEAVRIIFLGFGYNNDNLKRLFFKFKPEESNSSFYGTSYGLTFLEKSIIIRNIQDITRKIIYLDEAGSDVLNFLRNTIYL